MKILFYINILSDGGAERVIANLANYFSANNNEVCVVNTFKTPNEYVLNHSVKHVYLEEDGKANNVIIRNISRISKLRRLLLSEKPEIAVAFMPEPNFRLILAKAFLNIRTIVSIRDDPSREKNNPFSKLYLRFPLQMADGIVFQTNDAKAYFSKKIQSHSRIIFNPVNNAFYRDEIMKEDRRDIVTLGRLTDQKNHKLLIDAFARIKDLCEDNLKIYGAGPNEVYLKQYICDMGLSDRVFLMGKVTNVQSAIRNSKAFVLSSDYEGMPNALMEAMALGIPSISTDCPVGGPAMICKNGINSLLVPVGNVDCLADAMMHIINMSEDERYAMGVCARETAQMFKADNICLEWKDYMHSLLDARL